MDQAGARVVVSQATSRAAPGLRPGSQLQTPARSWLTDEAPKGLDEKRGPALVKRRDGAPKGATHRKMRALTKGCADWRAVPLLYEGAGNKGVPGAFCKEYGRRSVG